MQIYSLLPKKNCRKCGVPTCMAFAMKLAASEVSLEACPLLDPASREKLQELLAPPVKPVTIGLPPRSIKIGGEEVLYRHERSFATPTALALDVTDDIELAEAERLLAEASRLAYERLGQRLSLSAVAVRSVTRRPDRFSELVEAASRASDLPLVLCSLDPAVMEAGLRACRGLRPLIYAADAKNFMHMAELAARFDSPLAVHGPTVDEAAALVRQALDLGLSELVIDLTGPSLAETVSNLIYARGSAVRLGVRELGYPLAAHPLAFAPGEDRLRRVLASALLLLRYASLLFVPSLDPLETFPLLVLRQGLYSDPRRPLQVKAGLYEVGSPGPASPVLLTTNYALTYFLVRGDAEASGVPSYIVVVDTQGLSVACSVAGGKLTPDMVAEAIRSSGVERVAPHRTLVIPGRMARLKYAIEDATGWRVVVGPRDSSELRSFLRELKPG